MQNTPLRDGAALEPQFRTFHIERDHIDEDARTVSLSFSSEEPVQRWFGREVLDHDPASADLTRLNDGGAVLFEHDPAQQIGVVEEARIDSDRIGRARVRFSRSAKAQEVFQDIADRIKSKVSFGYRIREADVEEGDEEKGDLYRVRSWEALEVSIVSIPADATVGVGRSESNSGKEAPVKLASKNKTQTRKNMDTNEAAEAVTDQVRAAAPVASEPQVDVSALRKEERERIREINAIGSRFGVDSDAVNQAVNDGVALDDFRKFVTDNHRPTPSAPAPSHEIGLSQKEKRNFSIRKAIMDLRSGRGLTGLEAEVSNATADQLDLERGVYSCHIPLDISEHKRDLEAGVAAEGGNTVQTDLSGSMIELLRNRMTVVEAGATLLSGLRGNVAIPKQDGAATASWVDEEGSVSETAQSFAQVTLSPQRLSARTVYSDLLIKQSSLAIENMVRDDLMRVMAIELDRTALHGSGTPPEPTGIENTGSIATVTFGAAATWAKVLEFEQDIAVGNADFGSMSWITTPEVRGAWKALEKASSTAQFVWGSDNMVNGYNTYVSNQVASDKVVFGNFSQLLIGSWGSSTVTVDPYSKAQTGQFVVTISSFHDVAVRHPEAFSFSTDSGAQ